ncbi:tetratricopeptide repeat protein [Fulvivirga sp. M361]|uniref:type IX secretion system periplasmic lipoprotein PorW/SprE n=1 Tax=Fulvivirga sp. M361 TaxID=2594266 RepID=UPI00117A83D6|nr:tetratricopeptide repeat protein [Fulvivirga sp. M361]TRX53663.1 tetratricopeptide repeat protein [Fulvivirga sp. M361]
MRFSELFIFFIAGLFLSACSAERKNVISKTYHNTTARYNAYFYAKESIREIEKILEDNRDNDYDRILKIYPKVDSALAESYKEQTEEVIKKASIAIERHKNSRWVDDSYILVGLARYYSLDFVNAIETFKYVNIKGESDDERHRALIHLLRTFTEYEEYNNAVNVSDFLKKEDLNRSNEKYLHLNRAYYYEQIGNLDKELENLVKAAPLLKKKDGKGRIYFIIGQIYQKLGFGAEAFNYYKKCIASNPAYELDFYARLNMAQVAEIGKTKDVRATRRLFEKLLSDKKNREFKDRIYYEMGEFEMKQNNLDKAIEHYKASLLEPGSKPRQKGQSYLKLGIIYYDSLSKYELAKAYYDSTVTSLPEDYENYDKIKARQEILADFVEQLNTIQEQDSLLALAQLDSVEIRETIDRILEEEALQKRLAEQKIRKQERRARASAFNDATGISSVGWYFGNASAVALGQSEFKRIWGDRPLEDNWRRSDKESIQKEEQQTESTATPGSGPVASGENGAPAENATSAADVMFSQIPFTEEAQQAALNLIENALYKIGNIYKYNLEENENAIEAFESLLNRFPDTEYEPEVLYQLYLIYKDLNDEKYHAYESLLVEKYPNSTYAKLVINPNYTEESTASNELLKKLYKKAYKAFEEEQYDSALLILDSGLKDYPETVFSPRLRLLQILITGKTDDINLYQYQLTEFVEKNPDADITPYASELLESSRSYQERQRRIIGTEYIKYFEENHYFVLIFEADKKLIDDISRKIEGYNNENFKEQNLRTSSLILNDKYVMVMVQDFEDKASAFGYYKKYMDADPITENGLNSKFFKFVLTKSNFNIFYDSKDPESYLKFFEKNYTNGS